MARIREGMCSMMRLKSKGLVFFGNYEMCVSVGMGMGM